MINNFLYFFNKNQKKTLFLLFCFMLISTILEMAGLGFIFSIVGILNPANIESNVFVNKIITFLNLDSSEIIYYFILIFLIFYTIKVIFLIFYNWFE